MSRTPTIEGKITGLGLSARLKDMADLPIILRIVGHEDVALDKGLTSITGKSGKSTAYGELDLLRILVDDSDDSSGTTMTADVLSERLNTDDHVKVAVWSKGISTMLDEDVSIRREDVDGIECCVIETPDHDDG